MEAKRQPNLRYTSYLISQKGNSDVEKYPRSDVRCDPKRAYFKGRPSNLIKP